MSFVGVGLKLKKIGDFINKNNFDRSLIDAQCPALVFYRLGNNYPDLGSFGEMAVPGYVSPSNSDDPRIFWV